MNLKTDYPKPEKKEEKFEYTGETYVDEYSWLRFKEDKKVIEHLEAENRYTEAYMESTKVLREELFNEMKKRVKETDESLPVKKGDYYYYSRVEAGKQYSIKCRKKVEEGAQEEIILDVNKLAEGKTYMKLGNFSVSPNHKILAYSTDDSGDEKYSLVFKNLETGKLLEEKIEDTSYSFAWSNDNNYVFYTGIDEIERPDKVLRHKMGDSVSNDVVVYKDSDRTFFVGVSKSRDKKYIFFNSSSQVTSEVSYISADLPTETAKVVLKREKEVNYMVDHHEGDFYITTDKGALNNKVIKIKVEELSTGNFEEVVAHNEDIKIEYCMLYKKYMALYTRENGLLNFHIREFETGNEHVVNFPEESYVVEIENNPDYDSEILRVVYESLVTPATIYDYNMKTRELITKKIQEVPTYEKEKYVTKRVFVEGHDGAKIPLSIVHKKGVELNGENPFFLYGYGSYGICNDVSFSVSLPSLLDRGFVYAIAHIRGGGEMGRKWYEDGKKLKKMNTFHDFISCAEYVIEKKYTNKEKLVIHGRSAGGLLMGAVINMRPDLFKAALPGVPFVDALNTMMDPDLPLTVGEYDEWGNPNEKIYYDYIKSYSPYDNVKKAAYPVLLFQGGLNDPRVGYWEPAKMVARIRDIQTGDNVVLLHTKMIEGHSAGAARFDRLHDVAFRYGFFLKALGMDK